MRHRRLSALLGHSPGWLELEGHTGLEEALRTGQVVGHRIGQEALRVANERREERRIGRAEELRTDLVAGHHTGRVGALRTGLAGELRTVLEEALAVHRIVGHILAAAEGLRILVQVEGLRTVLGALRSPVVVDSLVVGILITVSTILRDHATRALLVPREERKFQQCML